jgi:hypothetical protein
MTGTSKQRPIATYTATCRSTYLNVTYGLNNFRVKQDTSGKVTALADAGTIEISNDGRYAATGVAVNAVPQQTYTFTELVNGVDTYTFDSNLKKTKNGVYQAQYVPIATTNYRINDKLFDGTSGISTRGQITLANTVAP